jgi:Tol biopolymer transport system component
MWDPSWLRTRAFWLETGLFLVFIVLIVLVAIVKPTNPYAVIQDTPTPASTALPFYYADTDPAAAITSIRRATTDDVNASSVIAVFNHATGSQPTGSLSPDGTRIALLINDKDPSDTLNGTLWLLQTDGSYFQPASQTTCSWYAWRQDSQALALFTQTLANNTSTVKTRITQLNLFTKETSLILEEDATFDLKPLGWSSGGAEFVVMSLNQAGNWSVASINLERNARIELFHLPATDLLRNAWLSPSGAYILLDIIRSNEALLLLSTLDGDQQVNVASVGVGLFSTPLPFTAIWSPDGQRLLINQPSAGQTATTWKTYELQGVASVPINLGVVDPSHILRLLAWSPDGKWLTMAESPFPYSRLYIKEISADDRLLLPLEKSDNQASWLGWSQHQ